MSNPYAVLWRRAGLVAAAPTGDRDRVVDLLRSGSLAVVVVGHVLMAVVVWDGDTPGVDNLLAHLPGSAWLTWALQVMPLFFLAGAMAGLGSWQRAVARGEPWSRWTHARVSRLTRPLLWYLALWLPLAVLLSRVLPGGEVLATLSTQLLWFLGVYVLVTALTPVTHLGTRTRPWLLPAVLALSVVGTDLLRFAAGVEAVAYLNFLLVWWFVSALAPSVRRWSSPRARAAWAGVAVAAVSVNLALTTWGPYPRSMVGLPGEPTSNMAPPTLVLALHGLTLCAVAAVAWPALERFTHRPRVWRGTVLVGAVAMPLYLWHLTALILVVVVEHAVGIVRLPGTPGFWLLTVVHTVVALLAVALVVGLLAWTDHVPVPWAEQPWPRVGGPSRAATAIGSALLGIGVLGLAGVGLAGFPLGTTVIAGIPLTPVTVLAASAVGLLLVRYADPARGPGRPGPEDLAVREGSGRG